MTWGAGEPRTTEPPAEHGLADRCGLSPVESLAPPTGAVRRANGDGALAEHAMQELASLETLSSAAAGTFPTRRSVLVKGGVRVMRTDLRPDM